MNEIEKIFIIAFIAVVNVRSMKNIWVGDTVNLYNEDDSVDVKVSDIFNGFDGSNYIKKQIFRGNNYELFYDTCLIFESLKEYFYPKVYIDDRPATTVSSKLYRNMSFWRDTNLGIYQNYVNDKEFRYGVVKLCKTVERQALNIELVNENHFPKFDEGAYYNILLNKTVVFRLRRNNETHYVSSVLSGTCLVQIYIREAINCMSNNTEKSLNQTSDFFNNAIYRSHFLTINNDHELEDDINEYYFRNNMHYALFSFSREELIHQKRILEKFRNDCIVSLSLHPLPELPVEIRVKDKNIPMLFSNLMELKDIIPGDVFSLNELLNNKSRRTAVRNILNITNKDVIPPFLTYNYLNCHHYIMNEDPEIEYGKINIFEKMLKHQNYGLNPQYLNEEYTCLKMTICSRLMEQNLHLSPLVVIRLNKESKNKVGRNIFQNKNIILLFSRSNETHFVTRTEKGNCLFQVLIYPRKADYYRSTSIFDYIPIHEGKILSATNNRSLENQVEDFVSNDFRNIIGSLKNLTLTLKIFGELSSQKNNALINLYSDELY